MRIFKKNGLHASKANLNVVELDAYQKLAQIYLSFSAEGLTKAPGEEELEEVDYDGKKLSE